MSEVEVSTTTLEPKKSQGNFAIIIAVVSIIISAISIYFSLNNQTHLQNTTSRLVQTVQQDTQQWQQAEKNNNQKIDIFYSEIHTLIEMANTQLAVLHNPDSAISILKFVQDKIANHPDYASLSTVLSQNITAIQSSNTVNSSQVFSEIADLSQSVLKLSMAPSKNKAQKTTSIDEKISSKHWYESVWNSVRQVKNLFLIRKVDVDATPLLDPEMILAVKQNIVMQLNMAQWALLQQNQSLYNTALKSASQLLSTYFSLNNETSTILTSIDSLKKAVLNPALPNLQDTLSTLSGMQNNADSVATSSVPTTSVIENTVKKTPKNNQLQSTTPVSAPDSVET